MPRIARVVVPDCPHHITQRGNRRENVFCSEDDRLSFLGLLGEYAARHGLRIDAYCLMNNHIHLVARPEKKCSLERTLKPVFLRYAQHVNRRHKWGGRVWQGRFFSCPLDDDHFWTAMRYVERNPVRARLVKAAEDYRWSSAACHCGMRTDGLLTAPEQLMARMQNWSRWLRAPEDKGGVQTIRLQTRTGRPAGKASFVGRLEKLLGRSLQPLPVGRPKRGTKIG